jgi:hypothetical protein
MLPSTTAVEQLIRYDDYRTSPLGAKMTNPPTNPPSARATRPSVQLTTDAVVASYIHEISERHRRIDQAAEEPSGALGGR